MSTTPEKLPLELGLNYAFEGESDYKVIPLLVERLIEDFIADGFLQPFKLVVSQRRPNRRGDSFLNELPTYVTELSAEVQIVVAIVDSGKGRQKERQRQQQFDLIKVECNKVASQICIADGIAVREMEAWLLADKNALKRVFNSKGSSKALSKLRNPEGEQFPKELLNKIAEELTNGNLTTSSPKHQLLAEEIDLTLLKQKCPAFADFAQHLLDCLQSWQNTLTSNEPS